ncbi:MAG TPA: hypothetical protein V6D11_28935 [Waterburya sp.]|jgi:high-affinity K+ transport system ATPase subunit B
MNTTQIDSSKTVRTPGSPHKRHKPKVNTQGLYKRAFRDACLTEEVSSTALRKGDRIKVIAGEIIPADGEVLKGSLRGYQYRNFG